MAAGKTKQASPKGVQAVRVEQPSSASSGSASAEVQSSSQAAESRFARSLVVMKVAAAFGLAGCCMMAAMTAAQEASSGEEAASSMAVEATNRRLNVVEASAAAGGVAAGGSGSGGCRLAAAGEPCYRHVRWAKDQGIEEHPEWYPGLSKNSSFEAFQAALHTDPFAVCPQPCGFADAREETVTATVVEATSAALGYSASGRIVADGHWCRVHAPNDGWGIRGCGAASGTQLKVLTYNLFWWNLFGRRRGNGGSAGKLIAAASAQAPFDVMAFQECEGLGWVLGDAGLTAEFEGLTGPHALCLAFRKTTWELILDDSVNVAEDRRDQWYGTRAVMWARLRHRQTGEIVFIANHHGPLPVDSGGMCGGEATAYNVLKVIAEEAHAGDTVVLVGDFNAGPNTATVQSLRGRLLPTFTGTSFGGVDHVLSSCGDVVGVRNLGSGGSDHDALEVVLRL